MEKETYLQIYQQVNTLEDIDILAIEFEESTGVIAAILNQKTVSKVKRKMGQLQNKAKNFRYLWEKGMTINTLAQNNDVPATLMASVIIKELGYSKKHVLKNLDTLDNRRLAIEIEDATNSDHFFSPKAHALQVIKGKMGEDIIGKWLDHHKLGYSTEEDLRELGMQKTPDFFLDKTLYVDGTEIEWIESKAMFGDEKEHTYYFKKQFQHYERDYGTGMVIYWYGHLDTIEFEGNLIRDHTFYMDLDAKIDAEIDELLSSTL
ncbi:MAG: C15orf41 family protein [Methanococcoides sp.]|nr:C15orf41 family protein [Methanococcoides sp.]MCD4822519.1 C15orf41 family protein [Methanococcoides sp.]